MKLDEPFPVLAHDEECRNWWETIQKNNPVCRGHTFEVLSNNPDPANCDHEWEEHDDSFDHEFGTEICISVICAICGTVGEYDPESSDYYYD